MAKDSVKTFTRRVPRSVSRTYTYLRGMAALRSSDVLLASFPKSGSTWIRFFLCNLISAYEWDWSTVTFSDVDNVMPELGVTDLREEWRYEVVPRVIKTHRRWLWPFAGKKSILIIRHPGDVFISLQRFFNKQRFQETELSLSDVIRHKKYGASAWLAHYRSWRKRCNFVVDYATLRKDPEKGFSEILDSLDVKVSDRVFHFALENTKIDNMRKTETIYGHSKPYVFREGEQFVSRGSVGEWRQAMRPQEVEIVRGLVRKVPELGYEE